MENLQTPAMKMGNLDLSLLIAMTHHELFHLGLAKNTCALDEGCAFSNGQ